MSVNIPINNDILVEGNENFIVFLSSNDPRADISGSPASVTIIDDDGKTVHQNTSLCVAYTYFLIHSLTLLSLSLSM